MDNYSTSPSYSGTSDHDAQLITIYEINHSQYSSNSHVISKINQISLKAFKLSFELWEDILEGNDTNKTFNYF